MSLRECTKSRFKIVRNLDFSSFQRSAIADRRFGTSLCTIVIDKEGIGRKLMNFFRLALGRNLAFGRDRLDGVSRPHQRQVRKRLWEVAYLATQLRVILLREKPQVITYFE